MEVSIEGSLSEDDLHDCATEAFSVIEQVHRLMSFHESESDVSRLNATAHLGPVEVHEWTIEVLQAALDMSQKSEGAFDITIAPHLVRSGLLPQSGHETEAESGSDGWRAIRLEKQGRRNQVAFQRPLKIDLGGIAKGFAVDKAVERLGEFGLESALVNAGGDLRLVGRSPGALAIRHPGAPTGAAVVAPFLRDAVATSGAYFIEQNDRGQVSQFIDPHLGRPIFLTESVTIFSRTCMTADALTKVAIAAGRDVLDRCLFGMDSVAWFVDRFGVVCHRGP